MREESLSEVFLGEKMEWLRVVVDYGIIGFLIGIGNPRRKFQFVVCLIFSIDTAT